jgi:uncharacterized protein YjbJ (UPF0337 family)
MSQHRFHGGGLMDKDRVKGTIDELLGSAKQKVGELTGDTQLEVEGIAQHVKGNLESAWGRAKNAVREAKHTEKV